MVVADGLQLSVRLVGRTLVIAAESAVAVEAVQSLVGADTDSPLLPVDVAVGRSVALPSGWFEVRKEGMKEDAREAYGSE